MSEIKYGFTLIKHEPRIKHGLTNNDYALCSMVYHLSNNPQAPIPGWCSAPKQTMAEALGYSRQTAHKIIDAMIDKGFIERMESTGFLRTTLKWYQEIECFEYSKESVRQPSENPTLHGVKKVYTASPTETLHTVKKVYTDCKESLQGECKESLHYNNSIDTYSDKDSILAGPVGPVEKPPASDIPLVSSSTEKIDLPTDRASGSAPQAAGQEVDPAFGACKGSYLKMFPEYNWKGKDGTFLNRIIADIRHKIKLKHNIENATPQQVTLAWEYFLAHIPQWNYDHGCLTVKDLSDGFEKIYNSFTKQKNEKAGTGKRNGRVDVNEALALARKYRAEQPG